MIKLRVQGTREEVDEFIKIAPEYFEVLQCSQPYENRGVSKFVRVYMDMLQKPPRDCKFKIQEISKGLWGLVCSECHKIVQCQHQNPKLLEGSEYAIGYGFKCCPYCKANVTEVTYE